MKHSELLSHVSSLSLLRCEVEAMSARGVVLSTYCFGVVALGR